MQAAGLTAVLRPAPLAWRIATRPRASRSGIITVAMAASGAAALAPSLTEASVVVITKKGCPYCKRAKAALNDARIPFAELDASDNQQLRGLVHDLAGSATVPQVFVGGSSIGGSDDLAAGLASGSFRAALAAAQAEGKPGLPPALQEAAYALPSLGASTGDLSDATPPAVLVTVADMLAQPATGIQRTPVTSSGRALPAFTGQELYAWLQQQAAEASVEGPASDDPARKWLAGLAGSPAKLTAAAGQLLAASLVCPVSDTAPVPGAAAAEPGPPGIQPHQTYLLAAQVPDPPRGEPLNVGFWWGTPTRSAGEVSQGLRELILALYDRHLSADGRAVSYAAMGRDPLFRQYVAATAELQRVDLAPLGRDELAALFINLYNALVVHALVVVGQPRNTAQRAAFFRKDASYCIGGRQYSADDMEHGVLRGNRPPVTIWSLIGLPGLAKPQLAADDPRAAKVVTPLDPRMHAALVCGAKSCPPIAVYTPDNLEEGLAAAAEAFCAGEVEVDVARSTVTLSKIFDWYSIDFGRNDREKLQYISQFLKGQQRQDLEALLASGKHIKVSYKPYDWGLNE